MQEWLIGVQSIYRLLLQESALRSHHTTVVKKGWLFKGPDSTQEPSIVGFTRVSLPIIHLINTLCHWITLRKNDATSPDSLHQTDYG